MKPSRTLPITLTLPNWLPLSLPSIFVAKELRAVFPASILGLAFVFLAWREQTSIGSMEISPTYSVFVILFGLAYSISCAATGSMAVGHDFMHGTLGTMLALPISRAKIWRMHLLIAFLAMLPTMVFASATLFLGFWRAPLLGMFFIFVSQFCVPILNALFVAPWLTLISRSALFGTVFTVCIPFLFLTGTNLMIFSFGLDHRDDFQIEKFRMGMMAFLLLSHWLAGGILGWHKFMHLEDIGNRTGVSFRPSQAKGKAATLQMGAQRNPVLQLVKKELMLQRIPFVMVGLFIVVELCLLQTQHLRPELGSDFPVLWTVLCAPLLSLLIGAVSSAEERQLGIAEWQILLPISSLKQWIIKVLVVLVMSALFGGLLPALLLDWVGKKGDINLGGWSPFVVFVAMAILFASVSLYISSLCNSGVKAMLVSLPVSLGIAILLSLPTTLVLNKFPDAQISMGSWSQWAKWPPPYLFLGGLAFALRLGMLNHRSSERGFGRIWRQVGCLVAYSVLASLAFFNYLVLY